MKEFQKLVSQLSDVDRTAVAFLLATERAGADDSAFAFVSELFSRLQAATKN